MTGYLGLGLLCATLSLACYADDDQLCVPLRPQAVAVDVREAGTGLSLAAGARGAAQTGSRIDSLTLDRVDLFPDSVLVGGATESTYKVRIEHPGYAPWVRENVVVTTDGYPCPVLVTQALTAQLEPID